MKDKTTEKRGGQEKSEGDDDSDNDVGDAEGDGDNALRQNVSNKSNLGDNWTPQS